jgi:hypothetical protein
MRAALKDMLLLQSHLVPCCQSNNFANSCCRSDLQCVEVVLGMISDSLDAWRTRQYDYYQRVLNGIL